MKNLVSIDSLTGAAFKEPIYAYRKAMIRKAVSCFLKKFNGHCLYAVKTNAEDYILKDLYKEGIKSFDVASLEEVKQIHELFPKADMYFMHPVKSRHTISQSYFKYGIRHFSLDSEGELLKILEETDGATDLNLHVRLSIPNSYSELNLSEKFGVALQEAPDLLKKTSSLSKKIGICFHVGSQCMHPDAYKIAIRMAIDTILKTNIPIDYFNIGGGFPSIYPGMMPPSLDGYFESINLELDKFNQSKKPVFLCEPGRALVAESTSLIVKVDLRKDTFLYINEGTFGALYDAGKPKFTFPVRMIAQAASSSSDLVPFSFYGPTCDSADFMKGPFYLPNDIQEGDYIEIGQMGAYAKSLASNFNGFKTKKPVFDVNDDPLMTLYDDHICHENIEMIAA